MSHDDTYDPYVDRSNDEMVKLAHSLELHRRKANPVRLYLVKGASVWGLIDRIEHRFGQHHGEPPYRFSVKMLGHAAAVPCNKIVTFEVCQ